MKKFIKQLFPNLSEDGDIRFLYKNSRYKLFYEIIFFIVSFFITWCFGNLTSPEFYGTYLFIINIVIFFSFLSFAGIEQSLTQSVANGYDYFFITAIKKKLIYSFFGGVIIFIFAVLYALLVEFNYVILVSIIISGLFFPFTSVFNLYHFFLDGKGDFKRDLIFRLITYTITSVLLLILIFISIVKKSIHKAKK